ncbi:MAG: hypothetical protein A2418_00470 [Candidatus Brennerbacteria bacterium RIFOXYC1_FULL_41_11]|uniref:Uncharacterized protein n=1 Tax=Candidatus Brennerbacteria bacterium RIFOXYD1_FULL_41_16 TaxID=1797529 RepID=A0A1G1XKA9_9BACT|nr:MAG: hypothetical protein UU61_C0045G0003 [Parcubacteria group bacterium GW2011_GWB1_41_4]OGY39710.1 MAG: hypothetical protein A2418_00470 [Candidatus Brennerbacteria bacterium RIFOXYC1_FULL_41_11]OGY40334.1 MAG: hypothetical protein A2570_03595 [Candidatus Brennerbacteria bacterium RIFOXYD1_FULL_41_16]
MEHSKKPTNRLVDILKNSFSILTSLFVVGFMFIYYGILGNKPTKNLTEILPTPIVQDEWSTYRNAKFNFEIKYPREWMVSDFSSDQIAPIFNFYPPTENSQFIVQPYIHFSDADHVSVFPYGYPTEGINGEYQESNVALTEKTAQATDFILEDGTPWATFISFSKKPRSWQESGFIFSGAKMPNQRLVCMRGDQPIPLENCDPFTGDLIIRSGEINAGVRKLQEMMLSSFKFIQ